MREYVNACFVLKSPLVCVCVLSKLPVLHDARLRHYYWFDVVENEVVLM